jgi:protein gp37
MADNSLIEWCDATCNAVNGCSVLSPGCTNCYAMKLAGTRLKHHPSRAGLTVETKAGPVWNGTVRLNEDALMQPLRWKRPRRIFWNAHGDLFHEAVPDEWIDHVFAVCALTPAAHAHDFDEADRADAGMGQLARHAPERRLNSRGGFPNVAGRSNSGRRDLPEDLAASQRMARHQRGGPDPRR